MKTLKGVMSTSQLIGAIIVAVVFGALIGIVADTTLGLNNTGNITGATSIMLGLVPLFLTIAVIVSYVADI